MVFLPKSLYVSCNFTFLLHSVSFFLQSQDGAKGVPVGAVIAIVGEEGDDISGADAMASKAASAPPPSSETKQDSSPPKKDDSPPAPPPSKSESPKKSSSDSKADLPTGDRIFASPIAKKIALERGIPLAQVKGSGPEGRIIREDVEKFKPSASSATSAAASPESDYVDTPVSNMRRTIGSRLTQSKQELPHYYVTVDVNMDKVLKLREVFNKTLTDKDKGAKLSVNDFVVKAVSCALADVPEVNSAWLGEVIRQYVLDAMSIGNLFLLIRTTGTRRRTSPSLLPLLMVSSHLLLRMLVLKV